ncbi:hypothetical protein [Sphingomonas nostoxanthinifaciens]|uniref:hypothetical protein n=1 Tax=Sphingomonas nostoxanthinifaciens TaxID=2872652 RepID=UPI001CC20A2A|nr:hypothetical protein [Sphingomonas nostoxanthinifaciens]
MVELYRSKTVDAGQLERSRNHFIRYRLDQLFENLSEDGSVEPVREAEEVALLRADAISKGYHRCH